jgi:SNF2 family DNA or RNA helicase
MKPGTFDYDRVGAAQPQEQQAPVPSQPVYIPTAGMSAAANDYMTATETEKALRDLISGDVNDNKDGEINPEDKVVKGFKDGIKLLDHQVIGRNWMSGRENPEEKKYGGILADDMG